MSDYFGRLAARALGALPEVAPRRPSVHERQDDLPGDARSAPGGPPAGYTGPPVEPSLAHQTGETRGRDRSRPASAFVGDPDRNQAVPPGAVAATLTGTRTGDRPAAPPSLPEPPREPIAGPSGPDDDGGGGGGDSSPDPQGSRAPAAAGAPEPTLPPVAPRLIDGPAAAEHGESEIVRPERGPTRGPQTESGKLPPMERRPPSLRVDRPAGPAPPERHQRGAPWEVEGREPERPLPSVQPVGGDGNGGSPTSDRVVIKAMVADRTSSDDLTGAGGWSERHRARDPAAAEGPIVRVSIGRVEVRAVQPPTEPQDAAAIPAPSPIPILSLDEYLEQRRGMWR